MRPAARVAAIFAISAAIGAAWAAEPPASGPGRAGDARLVECQIAGLRNSVLCGSVERPLDPRQPTRAPIVVRYVVVPAMARRKLADPVFLLAGGPGQSAIGVAGATMSLFARLNNRRDIVFVDQRGTGSSAPLQCKDAGTETLAQQSDSDRQYTLTMECKDALLKLPYIAGASDLGLFTTTLAVRDLDAVRAALGAERIDLVGVSYGTRVALEYQRQFSSRVRRSVLDGVAPADMALPASFSVDNQAALDALIAACAAEPACARAHPELRRHLAELLQSLPRTVKTQHPLTGRDEDVVLSRATVLGALRSVLYVPAFAAALPEAIDAAARGDMRGLSGLNAAFSSGKANQLANGMHLSVVCAEDVPRLAASTDKPGPDFGNASARFYERMCSGWPRGEVPAAFYDIAKSPAPVLVLSGGLDPATPPRHGERVAKALGPLARHVVVANAGHGVLGVGCMRDVLYRFIDAVDDDQAMAVDAGCAAGVPRPPAFRPIVTETTRSGSASAPSR